MFNTIFTNLSTYHVSLFNTYSSNFSQFNSFSSSSVSTLDESNFNLNHQRKFILSTLSLSNKDEPCIYSTITGLPDNAPVLQLLQDRNLVSWNSLIVVSKYNTQYGNLNSKNLDLILKDNSKVFSYNLSLSELIFLLQNKNLNDEIAKTILNHGLFLFEGYDWYEIINAFAKENIIISGGLGTKRHILSPTQFRLFQALMFLQFNYSLLSYYFNHMGYLGTKPKNIHSSWVNKKLTGRRQYSTNASSNQIELKRKSLLFDYSPVYLAIQNILLDPNSTSIFKQQEIEKLLNDTWLTLYTDSISISNKHSKDFVKLLKLHIINFNEALSSFLSNIKSTRYNHLQPLFNLPINDIALVTFNILFPILYTGEEINKTKLVIIIGKSIFNRWVKSEYLKVRETCGMDFSTFKNKYNFTDKEFLNIGDLIFNLIYNNSPIFHIRIDNSDPKNTILLVSPEIKIKEMFEKKLDLIGFKLPMVCPPVKWSSEIYGGYLSNNNSQFEALIKPSKKSGLKTKISFVKKDIIYNTVNYMSQVPYKINTNVLTFILDNYEALDLKSELHLSTKNYFTSSRKIKSEIEIHNSLFYLQKNIIGLAKLLSNISQFYFPIEMDWRGRLYCQSTYISFQGNELAKSLLQFCNGKPLTDSGLYYLKIYGANCFGKDKESFLDRVKWVDDNHQQILDMNIDFILKASEPFIFIAFCLEYRSFIKDPNNFVSQLPIMLDASCNGLQHLSAMVGDSSIAKNVNLLESDPSLKPMDFYQFCLNLVNKKIKELSLTNSLYARIAQIELTRPIIKRSIMTIPYNVTKIGISQQLEEYFEWVKIDNTNLLKPKWYSKEQTPTYISKKELYILADLIHSTLYDNHPKLKELVKYLTDMAELLFKLSLPVVWITPSGLIIKQSYIKFKKLRIKPSLNKTESSYTILIPTKESELSKQKAGFMPNLVHSMDAANICLMVNYLIKQNSYINLFTVHDCFASTAESIDMINTVVRLGFLSLYSEDKYLTRLHNFYIDYIQQNYSITEENTVISPTDEELKIPIPPKTNNLNLKEVLDKAIYLIH